MLQLPAPLDAIRQPIKRHGAELALSLRVTIAAILALILAKAFQLHLPLWAVLTAVVVTQASVGRSLKATIDYLAGTFGGALYGGAIAVLVPHSNEIELLGVLALALAPLVFLAAMRPNLSVAPITAIIVLLVPEMTHASPVASAVDRVVEVALGGITGCLVSLFVLPSNAHRLVVETTAKTLDEMASALGKLLGGVTTGFDIDELHRIQDGVGQALVKLNALGSEAEQERAAGLSTSPRTEPHLRTLLRLRHDIAMIGRAAIVPVPSALAPRLEPALQQVSAAFTGFLSSGAAALRGQQAVPTLEAVDRARDAYEAAVAAIRREGLTRDLSGEAAERLFAVGFALEQMRSNFKVLGQGIADWTQVRHETK